MRPLPRIECRSCDGSGGGAGYWRCPDCGGRGSIVDADAARELAEARADHERDVESDRRVAGDA